MENYHAMNRKTHENSLPFPIAMSDMTRGSALSKMLKIGGKPSPFLDWTGGSIICHSPFELLWRTCGDWLGQLETDELLSLFADVGYEKRA